MVVIVFGVWMSTRHDACRKSLTIPVLSIGAVIFLMLVFFFTFFYDFGAFFSFELFSVTVLSSITVFVLYRSIVGFFGAMKRSSILLWLVSLSNVIYLFLPQTLILKNSSKKFWIKGILLDIALSVSDHAVLHLGGNLSLHSVGVSVHVSWQLLSLSALLSFLVIAYAIFCRCFRFIVTNNGSGHSVTGLR